MDASGRNAAGVAVEVERVEVALVAGVQGAVAAAVEHYSAAEVPGARYNYPCLGVFGVFRQDEKGQH